MQKQKEIEKIFKKIDELILELEFDTADGQITPEQLLGDGRTGRYKKLKKKYGIETKERVLA